MRNILFNKRNQVKTNNNPTSSRFGSFLNGFTIIELIVTISIIGILSTIGIVSYFGWQKSTITAQLKSDLSGVATAMENARTFNNAYPTSIPTTFTSAPDTTLTYVSGNDTSFCIDAISVKDSTLHFYIDQSSGRSGAQTGTCATRGNNYTLTIVAGTNGTVNSGGTYASGSTPTITATPNANYIFSSWTGDTGCSGAASHIITMDANKSCTANFTSTSYTLTLVAGTGGTVNSGGSYASGSTPTITATPNSNYDFSSWTGDTGCSGTASHTINMDANKSCTANFTPTPITAPAAPTVTANTVGATTTWSWGAASCPGNTARYQYRYTYAPAGYDSGLIATASTSVGFTTSTEGQTYIVTVQAQCYNAVTTSSWSGSGSANYYRPIISCTGGTMTSDASYHYYTFSTNGTFTLNCPLSKSGVTIQAWGAGGGGGSSYLTNNGGAGGGGGGAYAINPSFSITSGTNYTAVVGTGGIAGTNNGSGGAGSSSTFNSNSVIAVGGGLGGGTSTTVGGTAGSGGSAASSTGITKYSGGNGAAGVNKTGDVSAYTSYSGAGGGSGGTSSNGNNATNTACQIGQTIGTAAVSGGGPGGGCDPGGWGCFGPPSGPGGGGGGGYAGCSGYNGQVIITIPN